MHVRLNDANNNIVINRESCTCFQTLCLMITVSSLFCCFAPGKDKPRVSTTDDMVFAVNIPPRQQQQELIIV